MDTHTHTHPSVRRNCGMGEFNQSSSWCTGNMAYTYTHTRIHSMYIVHSCNSQVDITMWHPPWAIVLELHRYAYLGHWCAIEAETNLLGGQCHAGENILRSFAWIYMCVRILCSEHRVHTSSHLRIANGYHIGVICICLCLCVCIVNPLFCLAGALIDKNLRKKKRMKCLWKQRKKEWDRQADR